LTSHNTKIKIRDFSTKEEFEQIAKALNVIAVQSGINEPLEDWALRDLMGFLKTEFKDFSFTEIREAFSRYNAGKLEFSQSAYQNFSQKFVGDVLKSYRSYRNKALVKYYKELEELERVKEPTEEKKAEIEKEFLETCLYKPYQKALENGSKLYFEDKTASSLFLKLLKKRKISVSQEEISAFRIKAKESLRKSLKSKITGMNQKSIKKLIDQLELQEEGSDAERRVKERAANLFFSQWINGNVENKIELDTFKI